MRVTQELLSNYQHVIGELKIIGGSKGIFDVDVDGTLIYSKGKTGRQANDGEVLAAFEKLLPEGTARYGT